MLNIQNPRKMRSKERLKFAFNRSKTITKQQRLKKRQQAFDNSTQRELSEFEYAKIIDLTTKKIVQVPSSQPLSNNYTIMPPPSS